MSCRLGCVRGLYDGASRVFAAFNHDGDFAVGQAHKRAWRKGAQVLDEHQRERFINIAAALYDNFLERVLGLDFRAYARGLTIAL